MTHETQLIKLLLDVFRYQFMFTVFVFTLLKNQTKAFSNIQTRFKFDTTTQRMFLSFSFMNHY